MNYEKLSKELSYMLRHVPWEYELELDEEGWVDVDLVLDALSKGGFNDISVTDLMLVIDQSDKRRHEMRDSKVRALYGHTTPNVIRKDVVKLEQPLYHGTPSEATSIILETGLLPMQRQYVHLSIDVETAIIVGKRKAKEPVLLEIDIIKAQENGVVFYKGNEKVYLADSVGAEYIRVVESE